MREMRAGKSASSEQETPTLEWKRWCRLCAKEDVNGNLNVFCKGEHDSNSVDSTLATAIGKYFWVNIKSNDSISKYICMECHMLVTSLVEFTERVNKVQAMFCLLQNSKKANAYEVRNQYGLQQDEWQHIIKLTQTEDEEHTVEVEEHELAEEDEEVEEFDEDESVLKKSREVEYVVKEEQADEQFKEIDEMDALTTGQEEFSFEYATDEAVAKLPRGVGKKRNSGLAARNNAKRTTVANGEAEDVDDSDLFKELKFKDDENGENDQYDPESTQDGEQALENITLEEDDDSYVRKRTRNKSFEPETDSKEVLLPPKRKRGRPPKDANLAKLSEEKRRLIGEADPDYMSPQNANEFRYQCKICDRKYKNATSYRKHMTDTHNTEPDIPNFTCDKCPDKEFPTEKQLAVHMRSHLPLNEKLDIPCPYCDKKFTKISVMRQHVSGIHYNEKPFVCDECGRALKTLAALNEHKLVHTEDCPYECDQCHKRFKNKARLKIHSDIHTTTMYVCPECGLQLNTRRTLKMHMLVHSDEKQFQCNFCGSAFKRSKALKNHLILHTGMRPYKCNFCDKTFSNGSNCRSHKKKMHPHELAEEEATGKKSEPTTVPKLEELRSNSNIITKPREVHRTKGGLPKHLRELLLKAEERAKAAAATTTTTDSILSADDGQFDEHATTIEIHDFNGAEEYFTEDVAIEEADDDDDEEDEGEEGETVIYEIIDEI